MNDQTAEQQRKQFAWSVAKLENRFSSAMRGHDHEVCMLALAKCLYAMNVAAKRGPEELGNLFAMIRVANEAAKPKAAQEADGK